MNPERWQQCKQVFQAALDLPRGQRAAFVRDACGADDELRQEVESLLASAERSDEILSTPAARHLAGAVTMELPDSRLSSGEMLASRYRIVRLIGRGGMGEVYEAEDVELHARVALKLVRPEIALQAEVLERFKREVYLARQVTHANVCRIFDLGYHAGPAGRTMFLTMELLAGETLADRLKRAGAMQPSEALPVVTQLTAGLAAAHREGIVHRDFKSANVILLAGDVNRGGSDVRVKIMDFGLARGVSDDSHRTTLTGAGWMVGTPAYMAPEQIEGGDITAAVDIYALGVVIYEMMTGVLPFSGDSPWIVATKRLREAPLSPRTRVPGLPREWESVILRCLERSPAARFQTAMDVSRALSGEPVAPSSMPKTHARRKHRPLVYAAALAALVMGSALGWLLITKAVRSSASRSVESGAPGPARFGWHQITLAADASLAQAKLATGSADPLEILSFGPSFVRTWEPGQTFTPPLPMRFAAAGQAECATGLWLIHEDARHITNWDPDKKQPITTISLPWAITSAACLDAKPSRWGFLVNDAGTSRWVEYDAAANRTLRTVPLGERFLKATIAPQKRVVAFIGISRVSVRSLDGWREVLRDELGEKLLGVPGSGWSGSGRYLALGFKLLVIYDLEIHKRTQTLNTIGWITEVGWIADEGISAMDDRGRLYWTSDPAQGWQLKQEAPAPGVYQSFWIASQYRWLALNREGAPVALIWEYATPSLLFDLPVSPLETWSVAASPENSRLAVAGKDSRIFIVDLQQKKVVRTLEGHNDGITFVRFEQAGRLISASDDRTIRRWDIETGKVLETASGHESLVNAFAISPDKKWLVSVSSDNTVKAWRLPALTFVKDLGTTAAAGAAVAFLNGDSQRLLVSDWKGDIYSYQGEAPDWSMRQHTRLGEQLVYMVCAGNQSWWTLIHSGASSGLWVVPASDITKAVRVSPDPAHYCSTASDGKVTSVQFGNRIEVRSNDSGQVTATYRFAAKDGFATAISYHPPTVVAGFGDGHVMAWPLKGQ